MSSSVPFGQLLSARMARRLYGAAKLIYLKGLSVELFTLLGGRVEDCICVRNTGKVLGSVGQVELV